MLIAFVVVAAVFSYVVLGAGFFTTQKSQEVVHTGVEQASSTLEVVGNVYGTTATAGDPYITYVNFSVGLAAGGTAVDFDKVVLTYSNATELVTLSTSVSTKRIRPGTTTTQRVVRDRYPEPVTFYRRSPPERRTIPGQCKHQRRNFQERPVQHRDQTV